MVPLQDIAAACTPLIAEIKLRRTLLALGWVTRWHFHKTDLKKNCIGSRGVPLCVRLYITL